MIPKPEARLTLRGYQRRAIRDILRALATHRRVLFVEFMGAGKTVIAASLARDWLASGARILVLTHRAEILRQTVARFARAGIPEGSIGVIWSDHATNAGALVQVASVATLARRDAPEGVTHVIVDEAHHASAASWKRILGWYPDAKVLGLTATPERLDGKPLREFFDEMVVGEPCENLIEAGWLARPEIWTREDGWLPKGMRKSGGDYTLASAAHAMNGSTIVGGIPKAYLKHARGLPAVLFAATKEQARGLVKAFARAKVSAETFLFEDSDAERAAKLARLRGGKTMVLCTCDILAEGWDFDGCRCVIMARPTASLARYMQWAGRCMRPGERSVILDHAGNYAAHLAPWEEREWSLDGLPRKSLHSAQVDREGRVTFLEPVEVDGRLVRAGEVQRQAVCPGVLGDTSCPRKAKPPQEAFRRSPVARRGGGPWVCGCCATRRSNAARTPEQRSERTRLFRATCAAMTPEQRNACTRKGWLTRRAKAGSK